MRRLTGWLLALSLSASVQALELHGKLVQGAMVWGEVEPGASVRLNGEPVRVAENGRFVFGFGRDAEPKAELAVCRGGQCETRTLEIASRDYDIQYIEGVPQETVSPPPEALKRIRREARLVRKARQTDSTLQAFADEFRWPIKGPVTGVFGSQRVYNGEPRRPHYGVDVARPAGATVRAPASGKVTLAYDDMFFSGGTLVIDHGHGISSTFIHLSRILVKEGETVEPGDPIAEVGATGRATGPHLDWRMNWFGERLDPELLVGPMPEEAQLSATQTDK